MLVGVTPTCVGNSRFPRLSRLARNTCGPGIGRPLYQKNAITRVTRTIASAIHSAGLPESRRTSFIGQARKNARGSGATFAPEPARCQGISPGDLQTDAMLGRAVRM